MNLESAVELLSRCTRFELRDHAFGDCEVVWTYDDKACADGYFSGSQASISVDVAQLVSTRLPCAFALFDNGEAQQLRRCGVDGPVERNDETGPETYAEGVTMPGLTLEGVLKELTRSEDD